MYIEQDQNSLIIPKLLLCLFQRRKRSELNFVRPLLCILQYQNTSYTVREIGFKLQLVFQTMTVSSHIYIFLQNPSRFPPHSPSKIQCNSHRRTFFTQTSSTLLLFFSNDIKNVSVVFLVFQLRYSYVITHKKIRVQIALQNYGDAFANATY